MANFGTGYIFGFAAGICVVCSLAVASTSLGLRDIQEQNRRWDSRKSILGALQLPEDGRDLAGAEIDKIWDERVKLQVIDANGKVLDDKAGDLDKDGDVDPDDFQIARDKVKGTDDAPEILAIYQRQDGGGAIGAFAVPMYGVGLWGPISGFLALDENGRSVIGATFFAPKETPGLGAEIVEPPFKAQWQGKLLVDRAIDVVKPGNACPSTQEYCVDGVSGATITSRGVDGMVEEMVALYNPYLKTLR